MTYHMIYALAKLRYVYKGRVYSNGWAGKPTRDALVRRGFVTHDPGEGIDLYVLTPTGTAFLDGFEWTRGLHHLVLKTHHSNVDALRDRKRPRKAK